jgi:hypothetical protein
VIDIPSFIAEPSPKIKVCGTCPHMEDAIRMNMARKAASFISLERWVQG